jgi:hypothetical protein
MLARAAQTTDRSAAAPKPMVSETRRRIARRGAPAAAKPTAKGGRRATRLTLATRQDD